MSGSTRGIRLCQENILDIARNSMQSMGWKCEWGAASTPPTDCKVVLVSWNAYLKHLLLHCKQGKHKGQNYSCQLPRCNVPQSLAVFSSPEDLATHIQQSHLNRSPLLCPVIGCKDSFTRTTLLEKHFQDSHSHLLGQHATSNILLPSWLPCVPGPYPLPELPARLPTASILVGDADGSWRGTSNVRLRKDGLQMSIGPPKKGRMFKTQDAEDAELPEITFEDLPKQSKDGHWTGSINFVCLTRQVGPWFDLSRPQAMFPPERCVRILPPQSIHYKVFATRLEEMEKSEGEDAALGSE